MSVEVRYVTKGECTCGVPYGPGERPSTCEHFWECDYGRIPSFDIENPAPLTITGRDFAHWVFKTGPRRISRGSVHTVTVTPIPDAHGEVTATSEIRMFHHIEYRGRNWTWELLPAHWVNPDEIRTCIDPIYLGRWPD